MHEFSEWFNYQASLKILVFAMLAGAALPGLFALGIRFQAVGAGQQATGRRPHTRQESGDAGGRLRDLRHWWSW